MKTCLHCGSGNRDEAKFCLSCGARLVPVSSGPTFTPSVSQPLSMPIEAFRTESKTPTSTEPESSSVMGYDRVDKVVAGRMQDIGLVAGDSGTPSTVSGTVYCSVCMAENDASSGFCENCGKPLQPVTTAPGVDETQESILPAGVILLPGPGANVTAAVEPRRVASESEIPAPPVVAALEPQPLVLKSEPSLVPVALLPVVGDQPEERRSIAEVDLVVEGEAVNGVLCPSCATVLRFCPCCGKPLSTNNLRSDRGF
jgi:hypothetical protein